MNINKRILFLLMPMAILFGQGCAPAGGGSGGSASQTPQVTGPVTEGSTPANSVDPADLAAEESLQSLPDTAEQDPQNPADDPEQGSTGTGKAWTTDVLLFNGLGISTSDWQTTQQIVKGMGLSYRLVNSAQLNAMSLDQIASYGMIIVPGGHAGGITSGLTGATRVRVRQAVRDRGVSYLGFCAGAFVAVERGANTNSITSYGFPVIEGSHLPVWWPNGNTSKVAAVVPVTFADGTSRRLVWWGGPSTPEWPGGVISRYANGKPAMSEARSGKGFVVLSGPHPEAPQGWRATAGYDADGLDYAIAQKLIRAALNRQALPAFK